MNLDDSKKNIALNEIDFNKDSLLFNFKTIPIDSIKSNLFIKGQRIPSELLQHVFLIPANSIDFENSYLQSFYYSGLKFELSKNVYIISYYVMKDLHDYETVWCIYDQKLNRIIGKLVVGSELRGKVIQLEDFSDSIVTLKETYSRHFINGLDGDNSKPVVTLSKYSVSELGFSLVSRTVE